MSEKSVKLPLYEDVSDALMVSNALLSASQSHGLLCGYICGGRLNEGVSWLDSILGHNADNELHEKSRQLLMQLYSYSTEQLSEMAFDFNMLLPDDEQRLALRARELGLWCEGFMYGLSLAGLSIEDGLSDESRDALLHFSEISKIDYDQVEITEEDEKAFTEVVEYARMAVLMIYGEFADQQSDKEGSRGTLH